MLELKSAKRKSFPVQYVQVTLENMADVASWTNGEVQKNNKGEKFVKVRVVRPLNPKQTEAYVGDFVLYAGTGYKVYNPKAFENNFEDASVETILVETGTEQPVGNIDEFLLAANEAAKRVAQPTVVTTPTFVEPGAVNGSVPAPMPEDVVVGDIPVRS